MSDLFKSAFGYFSSSSAGGQGNELLGQVVEIGNVKLRVKKVIAEGKLPFLNSWRCAILKVCAGLGNLIKLFDMKLLFDIC